MAEQKSAHPQTQGSSSQFYESPILNSPYAESERHWELDKTGVPTHKIIEWRRPADFVTPIPKPKKIRKSEQGFLPTDQVADAISNERQEYHKHIINDVRYQVGLWRKLPRSKWQVTAVTAQLLEYWRIHDFSGFKPFFCQLEAVETAIWLTEVAPKSAKFREKFLLGWLDLANAADNAGLPRLALKMATGSGKTTVMAMIIAWQTLNAVRSRAAAKFSRGFLIVTPGLTIRDRLQVLKPNDPRAYYATRELVPVSMLRDLNEARIVITNYHAFQRREKLSVAKGTRAAIEGWRQESLNTLESDGEMLQRVLPELLNLPQITVINDEAHHCYREKSEVNQEEEFKALQAADRADAREEARQRREAARLWISGLEALQRRMPIGKVFDLSATPAYMAGSGYVPGTLFPWTMSDFSLMDAIECGIVKLPRVPVADNVPNAQIPLFRNLWDNIKKDMYRLGKRNNDPLALPMPLQTALQALYGHYEKTFESWRLENIPVPPCFIVVCNNTTTSRLVYEFISGFTRTDASGVKHFENGRLPLLRNYTDAGESLARPRTILVDSVQLERGDVLEADFAEAAKDEIEWFRREIVQRGGKLAARIREGKELAPAAIMREVMNTVGQEGTLGAGIRCVVSVGMLTEGWDANNVTHILGVRAFGSQLLCEQVIGRSLRRRDYTLNDQQLFNTEYADILGIPFDFATEPVRPKPTQPQQLTLVRAMSPERDHLAITFPRVAGYRRKLPDEQLDAVFTAESHFTLDPLLTGSTETHNAGIIGQGVDLTLKHLDDVRDNTVIMHLTRHLLEKYRDEAGAIKHYLYGQLRRIVEQWFNGYLHCGGQTKPGQLLYKNLADHACEKIAAAITAGQHPANPVEIILEPYTQLGSTKWVQFVTTHKNLWYVDFRKCHLNKLVTESDWEDELCRVADKPNNFIVSYVKNYNLGLEVPYRMYGMNRIYIPDFILRIDDGAADYLNLRSCLHKK